MFLRTANKLDLVRRRPSKSLGGRFFVFYLVASVLALIVSKRYEVRPQNVPLNDQVFQIHPQFTAGYSGFLSATTWVEFILEYSTYLFFKGSGDGLPVLVKRTCDLDTNWYYSRYMGAIAIHGISSNANKIAREMLRDAIRRFPQKWEPSVILAQFYLSENGAGFRDSAVRVLLPISSDSSNVIPSFVRALAFTLLQKDGKPEQAMEMLVQTYAQVPDPLIRFQFQNKIADLLRRNEVSLGASDSVAFIQAIGGMLDSKDASQVGMAKGLLVRLVQPENKALALAEAHQLAEQFKVYQKQAAAGR